MRKVEPFKYSVCSNCKTVGRVRIKELKKLKTMTCDSCNAIGLGSTPKWYGSMPTEGDPKVSAIHAIKEEAQKTLTAAWTEKDSGKRMVKNGIVTIDHVLKEYKKFHPDHEVSKKIKGDIRAFVHLSKFIKLQNVTDLNKITKENLAKCIDLMAATPKSETTSICYSLNTVHQTVRRGRKVITDCNDINIYAKAELNALVTEKIQSTKNKISYSEKDIAAVFEALKQTTPWFEVYYKIAYYSGMRRDHIISLKWSEIKETPEGFQFETYPDKSDQVNPLLVDINPAFLKVLSDWKEIIQAKFPDSPYIFPSPVNPRNHQCSGGDTVDRHIRKMRSITGLKGLNLHTMRHHFITSKFIQGHDSRSIMHAVGHANITQTQEYANDTAKDSLTRLRKKEREDAKE